MADKTPVRVVFNASNVATGMAEFQSGDTVAVSHGGTGLSSIGSAGEVLKVNAQNGDKYFVDIVAFKQPNESEINEIIEEYKSFAQERSASKMSEVINEDVFESARVNLNNLIF